MATNADLLEAELAANNHPVTGAYSVDDNIAADQVNAENIVVALPIPFISGFSDWSAGNGRAQKIKDGITGGTTGQVKNICLVFDRMLLGIIENVYDSSNPAHVQMVDTIVTDSILDATDKDALTPDSTIARWEDIGITQAVKPGNIQNAR